MTNASWAGVVHSPSALPESEMAPAIFFGGHTRAMLRALAVRAEDVPTKPKYLVFVAASCWVAQALYFQQAFGWLGFPDGGLTDLARQRKRVYPIFVVVCVAAAIATVAFGRKRKGTLLALIAGSALIWAVEAHLVASYDDGIGG